MNSLLSYPVRGPYGKSSYPGNCSGYVIRDLLNHFRPRLFVDPMEGSGTSRDVAAERPEIEYVGLDLRNGFNLIRHRLIDRLPREADYIFLHPPYGPMVRYSGAAWGDEPHPDDLSRCADREEFLAKLAACLVNIHEAVRPGGAYSILVGDYRKDGDYWAIHSDLIHLLPGQLTGILIKQQHNVRSDRVPRTSDQIIRIAHEYVLNVAKDRAVVACIDSAVRNSMRLRCISTASWRAIVEWALRKLGGRASLQEIYDVVSDQASDRIRTNTHWREKTRQILQKYAVNVGRGFWALSESA